MTRMTRAEYRAAVEEARRRKRRIPDPPERFDDEDPSPGVAGAAPGAPPQPGPADPASPGATPGEAGEPIQVPPPPEPPDPRELAEESGALEPPPPPVEPDDSAVETLVLAADSGLQQLPPGGSMSETERGLWRAAILATMKRLGIEALPLWAHWAAVGVGSLLPRLLKFRSHVWGGHEEKPASETATPGGGGFLSWLADD